MTIRQNLLLLALPILCGCASGKRSVYVDLDTIVRQEAAKSEPTYRPPTPPPPMPGMSFTIPAEPERTVRDSGGQITTSIAEIEKIQREAAHALNVRLRALYETEVSRFARDQLTKFEGERTKAYDAANEAIRKSFLEYGQKRGPLMASIAVLVGWPDPNPTSKGDRAAMNKVQQRFFDRNKDAREKIAELDKQFNDLINHEFAGAQAVSAGKMAELQAAIRAFRDQLNKKADDETAKQVRATPKDLDIRLAGARATVLPAMPAESVQIPAGTPMPPPPQVPSSGIGNGPEDRRRMVEQELQSWLGLNRFALAKRRQGVPDVTEEFKAWRKTLLSDGP